MTELEHNRIAELKAELFIKTEECNEIIRRCQDAEAQSARDMEVVRELVKVLERCAYESNLAIVGITLSKAKAHFGKRLNGGGRE